MDDRAFDVVAFQQIENFFFAGFGVQVDEFLLFPGGGDEILQNFSLRRIMRSVLDPVKIEADLTSLFPREQWTMLSHLLIEHGRTICVARTPKCEICFLNDICPSSRVR